MQNNQRCSLKAGLLIAKVSLLSFAVSSTSAWAQNNEQPLVSTETQVASNAALPNLTGQFRVGDQVFVGLPSTTIRDDAFIIGRITQILDNGDYQLQVTDYVEGHDYGAFCTPVAVTTNSEYGDGWEIWEDTRSLRQANLEFVVPGDSVMPYRTGQYHYIERNNTWVIYGRWLSDAPILAPERIERARNDAPNYGLEGMTDAFNLAIAHRMAFYEEGWGRPYWPYETVPFLNSLLDEVERILAADPVINELFFSKPRDREVLNSSVRNVFLISALDKLVKDSYNQLYEDLSKADANEVARLTTRLAKLGYEPRR
jgi:hypothetical protein